MKLKKEIIITALISFVAGIVIMFAISKSNKTDAPKDSVSLSLPKVEALTDKYLVKIEDFGVTADDFDYTYAQLKSNLPPAQLEQLMQNESAAKANVLETMINQAVVMENALKEGFLEDEENLRLFKNALQQALLQFYVQRNMPTDPNAFTPSKPEIDQAYTQYGATLRAQGLNAKQSQEYLVGQIAQQKQQLWTLDFIKKIKEGYRIERNKELLDKKQISEVASPQIQ